MIYNFDEIVDRRNSDSIKWNYFPADTIPMWVADMDFRAPEPLSAAIKQRANHDIYGYTYDFKQISECICEYLKKNHDWDVQPSEICYMPSVLCGLAYALNAFSCRTEEILIQTPAYPPFLQIPGEVEREIITADLVLQSKDNELRYEIDFNRLESLITPKTRLFLLCHPHNPTGKVFTKEELLKIHEICSRHSIIVIADEVHADLKMEDYQHQCFATISEEAANNSITLMSPSKSFNIPGLCFAFAVIKNPALYKSFNQVVSAYSKKISFFGITAGLAAYTKCDDWLQQLNKYLRSNRDLMVSFIKSEMPEIACTNPKATYLAWLDCSKLKLEKGPFRYFLEHAKVALTNASDFGAGYEQFVRINFGCRKSLLLEALEKMKGSLKKHS